MRLPIRPIRGAWPAAFERRAGRYHWADPAVVLDPDVSPEQFCTAMNAFTVGGTIKITRRNRHPGADRLLLDNVDLTDATIVDIGASDGSTSVDLIDGLPGFKAYVIADLYLYVHARTAGSRTLFYEPGGDCVMVAGKRMVGWPARSRLVAALYRPLIARAEDAGDELQQVLLLNPRARSLIQSDPRVSAAVHNIFQPWTGPRPDVIKVANLLRRDYFDDAAIGAALSMLLATLPDGGHLLIANNPPVRGVRWQAGLYRSDNGAFEAVAQTEHAPDIAELISSTRLDYAVAI
jgi:hypothetical protein